MMAADYQATEIVRALTAMILTKFSQCTAVWPPHQTSQDQNKRFSNAFSWMKSFVLWFKFYTYLFLRVKWAICEHWFQLMAWHLTAASQFLHQWWSSLTWLCIRRPQWLNTAHKRQEIVDWGWSMWPGGEWMKLRSTSLYKNE